MRILVIPDVHLKPRMFMSAADVMKIGEADRAVCLMDIPDDWGKEYNLELYRNTFDAAISFQNEYPDTLWCYGNHDLSYEWDQWETGFSSAAAYLVRMKLDELRKCLPDEKQMTFIHRIDNVLFLHGGLTHAFVRYYTNGIDYENIDAVIEHINSLGVQKMWDDASPLWLRPQYYPERMYKQDELLQVVGHTPIEGISREGNIISCDVFSTYRNGKPIGTQEFLLIDTETWEYEGINWNSYRLVSPGDKLF